jgi:hypothetical protein
VPIGIDNVHSLCFFFSFHFFEDLGNNFVIFRRGKPGDLYSFTISLKRFKKGRYPVLKVVYESKGKPYEHTYESKKLILKATHLTNMNICLATGSDNINSAIFYVNGVSHAFDNLKNSEFLWAKNSKMNFLLDKRLEYGGKIFMTLFTVIEDAGGVVYNLEQNKELRKKCFEQCDLYTSSNVISLKCQVCS